MSSVSRGMRGLSQKDEPHHDVEALRKLVADLKAESQQLSNEMSALEVERKEFEASTSALKQEFNIIGVAADISGWDDTLDTSDGVPSDVDGEDKKWFEENRKLEVKILNEEMRGVLTSQERECVVYDSHQLHEASRLLLLRGRSAVLAIE